MPMGTPPAHIRMSLNGTLGTSAEIFSCSLSLKFGSPILWEPLGGLAPNDAVWQDLADDAAAFWGGNPSISNQAFLKVIKFASIGDDGLYDAPPVEIAAPGGTTGTPGGGSSMPPFQVAAAVTLHTEADLGRVKGRFYLPLPSMSMSFDGRWSQAATETLEASVQTFLNNINNQPGLDVLEGHVVVASGGRRNDNGTVKLEQGLHPVVGVSVGRVPDTQRRRRNKLAEARGDVLAVTGQG